jgi:hypothetical protein
MLGLRQLEVKPSATVPIVMPVEGGLQGQALEAAQVPRRPAIDICESSEH